MRILYPILKSGSGSDIYYIRLNKAMEELGVESELRFYRSKIFGLMPIAAKPFFKDYDSYNIIHTNDWNGFAFKAISKPLIVTVLHLISCPFNENYLSSAQKIYYRLMLSYAEKSLRVADYVIAISKYTEKVVREKFNLANIQTIYCGIDADIFKPIELKEQIYPDKIKLLFVGNLTKRKGVDLLPKIMAKLDNRFLLFYTTGLRTRKRIFQDKRMLPLGRLTLQELVNTYNTSDMLVMPSRLEGFGYAALEAMACEKPVVATNCSSLPELIDNGRGGFLCEMDNVDDFVNKVKILAEDSELREKMGKYNREKVSSDFNLLKMGKEYEKVYKKTLDFRH